MPDVYAAIATADEAVQERLADVLEMRAADPQQRAMLDSYLDDLALPGGARARLGLRDRRRGANPRPAARVVSLIAERS
jgi:hypothetical protein